MWPLLKVLLWFPIKLRIKSNFYYDWGDQFILILVCLGLSQFNTDSPMSWENCKSQANWDSWSPSLWHSRLYIIWPLTILCPYVLSFSLSSCYSSHTGLHLHVSGGIKNVTCLQMNLSPSPHPYLINGIIMGAEAVMTHPSPPSLTPFVVLV